MNIVDRTRLRGGSKKGVYRLTFDDASTAVQYVWTREENYWPDSDDTSVFADASGPDLFRVAHSRLEAIGVRVPRIYHLEGNIGLVEDVRGATLEARLHDSPQDETMARLATALEAMRGVRAGRFGRGDTPQGTSCEQVVLDRALGHLAMASARLDRIADVRDELDGALRTLGAAVQPRAEYSLIHGELGPDHVLVDEQGDPVIIDIEGAMFFDVEWEHVFLRLRFGEHYERLRVDGLDERRMRFYELAMHLSLVAGPLRLLDGDFPERAGMMDIMTYNTERVLELITG